MNSEELQRHLLNGVTFSSADREFSARLDPETDLLVATELTALSRHSLPLEIILDAARADERGSELKDLLDLKRLLSSLTWN